MNLTRRQRLGISLSAIMVIVLMVWAFRYTLLRSMGNYLHYADPLQETELMVVLAGSPLDRANAAAELYHSGLAQQVATTGGQVPHDFAVMNLNILECDLTAHQLTKQGVPDSMIDRIIYGTSTLEESDTILQYCLARNIQSVTIVSSAFHTRRIKRFFKDKFEAAGITICIYGAPSSRFTLDRWWENEYGLLAVNNEYVKLLYYILKGH